MPAPAVKKHESPTAHLRLVDQIEQAAVLLHPLRIRVLELLSEPDSATGISRRLGIPRQKANYHLRELERAGLVELVAKRRKRNCVERIVRATARSYLINPDTLGPLASDPERIPDRLSAAYQVAVAARTIRDLAVLQRRAERAGKRMATFSLVTQVRFANAAAQHAFAESLSNAVAQLVAAYHDETAPSGRMFRFHMGAYPAITKGREEEATRSIRRPRR